MGSFAAAAAAAPLDAHVYLGYVACCQPLLIFTIHAWSSQTMMSTMHAYLATLACFKEQGHAET